MPELIERIAADLAAVRWPDAAEIRRLARRRRRRRAAVAGGLATIVAIAVAAPVALFRSAGDDSGPIGTAERLIEIPPEALLQPEDVGPGLVALRETVEENRPVSSLRISTVGLTCPAYPSLDLYAGPYRYLRAYTLQTPPTDPGDPTTGDGVLRQVVLRMDDGLASRVADDLKSAATTCADYVVSGPADDGRGGAVQVEATHRVRIVDEGFAGDQSFVLTHYTEVTRTADGRPYAEPGTRVQAVVRVGDLLALISWTDAVEASEARRLAARAASWLCVASNPPC